MNDELNTFVSGQEAANVNPPQKKKGRKRQVDENGNPIQKPKKEPKPKRDNIEYVNNLKSLSGVRKFLQIAIAKKAKSPGREEAIKRYDAEIEAAKARLEVLIAEATAAENPVAKLIELDEEPNKVITHFIKFKEQAIAAFEKGSAKMPKSILKNISNKIPAAFFDELGLDLTEALHTRHTKNDFRLQAVCKAFNFMAQVESGDIVLVEGKFKTKESLQVAQAAPENTVPAE